MLYVVFTEMDDGSIELFEKIPLAEANHLTEKLEKQYREEKKVSNGEFYLIDVGEDSLKSEALYRGTFKFGSYESPNIYQHIKKTLPNIKVDKSKEREKLEFLSRLESQTEERYKREDDVDPFLLNLDRGNVSKLNKKQRTVIYSTFLASLVGLSIIIPTNISHKSHLQHEIQESERLISNQNELIAVYEKGLNGDTNEIVGYFNESESVTDEQKLILANILIKEKKFKEVVNMYGDVNLVANLVSSVKQPTLQDSINLLSEFDSVYPTNNAKYDLSYWTGKYEFMLKIPEVEMNARRSRMKTQAHLKLGQLEEAKEELKNNNNEKLKSQISKYELLQAEISTLEEKLESNSGSYEERNKMKQDVEKKKQELTTI